MELMQINNHSTIQAKDQGKMLNPFIEANTQEVSLNHLKADCIIPVFADNESTIAHWQFIDGVKNAAINVFGEDRVGDSQIRVSHIIKGRVPSAVGKPIKELHAHEKTIYYQRCAFAFAICGYDQKVGDSALKLTIGGVRALNQENLYRKRTLEKFTLFIGYRNQVCTNLCVATDGLKESLKVSTVDELIDKAQILFKEYNKEHSIELFKKMREYNLDQGQFAHLVGRMKMYHHLDNKAKEAIPCLGLSDNQVSTMVKDYFTDQHFGCDEKGNINLWKLYNLYTGANKSSYIDSNLRRNVSGYSFINKLVESQESGGQNWFTDINNIALL